MNRYIFLSLIVSTTSFALAPFKIQTLKNNKSFNGVVFKDQVAPIQEEIGWHLLGKQDLFPGVNAQQMHINYPKKRNEVVIAVVDSGVDVNHEDLIGRIWINKKEIPNNRIDDDNNGYIDDVMGWNFIGNKNGSGIFRSNSSKNKYRFFRGCPDLQVTYDSYEITREVTRLQSKTTLSEAEAKTLQAHIDELNIQRSTAKENIIFFKQDKKAFLKAFKTIKENTDLSPINFETLEAFETEDFQEEREILLTLYNNYDDPLFDTNEGIKHFEVYLNFYYNTKLKQRSRLVQDTSDKFYGNNDVIGPNSDHGTHVAGIIAAQRNNSIGIKGISNNVKIMPIRVVPKGDERDKDVANAIYYAVDNGAQIINLSFGKNYSPNKGLVYKSIKYAEKNNVLIVHAAGNEGANNDLITSYPRGKNVKNWLEIGSSQKRESKLASSFSNFGKKTVDFFAPGSQILSLAPFGKYATSSGTSMAAPVVSASAAVALSFNSSLTPIELKEIIIKTARRWDNLEVFFRPVGTTLFSNLSKNPITPDVLAIADEMSKPSIPFRLTYSR